jgi:hypothetical protein
MRRKNNLRRPRDTRGGELMHTVTKLVLGGTSLILLAGGLSQISLDESLKEKDPIKKASLKQDSQTFKVLGLVGSGLFWFGCYKHSPKLTVGFGVASTALISAGVYGPKLYKLFNPKGYEAMERAHSRHRAPAPMTPVVTSGEFAGEARRLYRARHPFEPQSQQDQQQSYHHHHHHHYR